MMAIIDSRATDKEIEAAASGLRKLLGEISYEEIWGMREFAYPIKNRDKGHYIVWNFHADAETIRELEETLKLYPHLLRFLIMKVPEDYSPITLKEIEAGMDELRAEKAEKRGSVRNAMQKRDAKAKEASSPAPAPAAKKAAPEKEADKKDADKAEAKKDDKKSLDQKLDDILSDSDLGL